MGMERIRRTIAPRGLYATLALIVLTGVLFVLEPKVFASQLGARSLAVSDVNPGAITTHAFSLNYTSTSDIGSVVFEYCTSPLPEITCDTPTGLDVSGASLGSQSGETGFSIGSSTQNKIVLTRPAAPATNNPSSYTFANIKNPTGAPGTFYVRIATYESIDATGPQTDFGSVVNSTTQAVGVSSEVPPILKFCVGLTLGSDCTTADDNLIDLGDLRPAAASSGSSQMLAATNAEFGLAIAAYGTTMTSGNNIIPALDKPTVSAPGNAQFGINLRKNSDPNVGAEPSGTGIINPSADYNSPNKYLFRTGDTVATSPNATDIRKLTASYVVNVPPSQVPGVYTATLTYICTATF
jgi:hypothetical protein